MRGLLVAVLACTACYDQKLVECGDLTCPSGLVCSADETCVSQEQIAACVNLPQGVTCSYGEANGFCHDGACVDSLGVCGDGVVDPALGEQCDCGTSQYLAAPPPGCNGFNSDTPGATCRPNCLPRRCGDGIVDPGEQCDDGNTLPYDGCRADCQGRFTEMSTPTGIDLVAIAIGSNYTYAIGCQAFIAFDGSSWSSRATPPAGLCFDGSAWPVWASDQDDFFVLDAFVSSFHRYDGSAWTTTALSFVPWSLWGTSSTDLYIAGVVGSGANGNPTLWHWNGSAVTQVTTPAGCLAVATGSSGYASSVDFLWGWSATDIYLATMYACGIFCAKPEVYCHWDGTQWSPIAQGPLGPLAAGDSSALYGLSGITLTVLGSGSTSVTSLAVPGALNAISVPDPDELLGVGSAGLILQLDRTTNTWTHLVSPTDVQLFGVAGTAFGNVFVIGESGTVLH